MENGENKNLQGRREFFKEAAKKALPLFAVALLGTSALSSCTKENLGCGNSCKGTCNRTCTERCSGDCWDVCAYSCVDGSL